MNENSEENKLSQAQQLQGEFKPVKNPLSQVGGLAFSSGTVLMMAFGFVISIIMLIFRIQEETDLYTYLSYLASPLAITATAVFVLKYKKIPFKSIYPVKCHPKYYVIALMLIFGLLFFAGYADYPFMELMKLMGYIPREASAYFPTLTGGWIVLALLVIAVMPAFFEELLFRGIILNTCEKSIGSVRTVFIVGFCFALFHGSPEQTVYQFISGCAFAFIAIRSGSILPSVIMHFINNALIVIVGACGLIDEAGELIMSQTASIIITVLAGLCFAGAVIWLILDKKPVIKCEKGAVKQFFLFASVGIALLALNWILSFFIN
ncbi:MAG: CPBP family intramembrane metalloprotease [Clostridia bacterium]|nr:CPBP family intramembrane metalloprotease [Clostridia bacterium]